MSGTETTYLVKVDYSQSLQEMIDAGKYDWVDSNVKNLLVEDEGREDVELFLIHLNRFVSTEEAEVEVDNRGLQEVKIPRLLSLGFQYPYLQRQFSIVALGSVWLDPFSGNYCSPCLDGRWPDNRYLNLYCRKHGWYASTRFLAARA